MLIPNGQSNAQANKANTRNPNDNSNQHGNKHQTTLAEPPHAPHRTPTSCSTSVMPVAVSAALPAVELTYARRWSAAWLVSAIRPGKEVSGKENQEEGDQEKRGGQAPQLALAVLETLEAAVGDTELPLFRRGYSRYRLFRHWARL